MNRKTELFCTVLLLISIAGAASAQVRMGLPEETEPKYEFLAKSGVVTIPLELVNSHIVIPVSVDGSKPFRMILDTGMPVRGVVLYDSERVDALDLAYGDMKVLLGGVGGDSKPREAKVRSRASCPKGGGNVSMFRGRSRSRCFRSSSMATVRSRSSGGARAA